jgi:hypothetical protein
MEGRPIRGGPFPVTPEEEAAVYLGYADRYNWTPDQVDALPAWLDTHLPTLGEMLDDLREAARKRAEQK